MVNYKRLTNDELTVLFKGIIDRNGLIPKRDYKWFDKRLITQFIEYIKFRPVNSSKPTSNRGWPHIARNEKAACNLIKGYGKPYELDQKNIESIGTNLKVIRYSKLKYIPGSYWDLLKNLWLTANASDPGFDTRMSGLGFFRNLLLNLIMSDNSLEQEPMYKAFWRFGNQFAIHAPSSKSQSMFRLSMLEELFYSLIHAFYMEDDYDYTYGVRAAHVFMNLCETEPDLPDKESIKFTMKGLFEDILYKIPSKKTRFNNIAPILPKWFNPFTANEYIELVKKYYMEVEDNGLDDVLSTLLPNDRISLIQDLVSVNGNNIKLCTKDEVNKCMGSVAWGDEKRCITKYEMLTKIYPRGLSNREKAYFLSNGDLSTIGDSSIRRLLDSPDKIMHVASRPDAAKQYASIMAMPNGLLYLVTDALPYIAYSAMAAEFLKGYVRYMETCKELPSPTTMVYVATTIQTNIRLETILNVCPEALKYMQSKTTVVSRGLNQGIDWFTIARACNAIDLTVTDIYDNLTRQHEYIPLNFAVSLFSEKYYGLEDIIGRDEFTEQIIGICTKGSYGYWFDIVNEEIREVILSYLAKTVK